MVNFQDPAVESTDSCAYGFTGVYGNCGHIECIFFESCTLEVLARCGWYLYVGLLGSAGAQPFAIPEYL